MLLNGIVAAVITMIITIIGIPRFIMFFHKKKLGGQPTLEDVKQHASKAGTPTMGFCLRYCEFSSFINCRFGFWQI